MSAAGNASQNRRKPSAFGRRALAACTIVALLLVVWAFAWRDPPPDDHDKEIAGTGRPQTVADRSVWDALIEGSPYKNLKPHIKYVDDATCADCHDDIAAAYSQHPMGRSLAPVPKVRAIEQFTADVNHPLKLDGLVYEVRRDGLRQFHRETRLSPAGEELLTTEFEAAFAVGSGRTGRSYLVERDGHLFMSPLTWYANHGWDLSPGYEVTNSHFNRPVISECLFCHANRALAVAGAVNEYRPPFFAGHAIGCQRCHGPGELHIAAREEESLTEKPDTTIVNPARLPPPLRESVCQQCHLGGLVRVESRGRRREDFRPGLPWLAVEAVYLGASHKESDKAPVALTVDEPAEADRFVGHVEQMHQSRCYVASGGKLGCISCHDPHRLPSEDEKASYFRQRCLNCHGESDCHLPVGRRRQEQSDDSCYACHMPRAATQIRHAAATDHRIPRSADSPHQPLRQQAESPAWSPLIPFQSLSLSDQGQLPGENKAAGAAPFAATTEDDARNLAVAIVMTLGRRDSMVDDRILLRAIAMLAEAVERDPDDVPGRQAYALALAETRQLEPALRQLEEVLKRQPRRESALAAAASLLTRAQNWTAAAELWRQAREVNPWIVRYWTELALCQARLQRWTACQTTSEEALSHFPDSFGVRQLLIECRLVAGKWDDAQAEYDRLLALRPPKPDSIRRWWDEHPLRAQLQPSPK